MTNERSDDEEQEGCHLIADKDTPNSVREALIGFKKEELSAEDIRRQFGDMDGIERSIAAARAHRHRSIDDDELDDLVELDEPLDRDGDD